MPQEDDQKAGMVDIGVKQCRRLAATDLPAAVDLLAILAPLGDRPAVDDCLADLLGTPLDKAACADVAKVVRIAKAFAGPTGEKELFQAGIAWVKHHPQAAPREVLDLLDQLDELHEADRARVAAIRRPLLEKLVAANPQDVELAVQLAVALEAEGRQGDGKMAARIPPSGSSSCSRRSARNWALAKGPACSGRPWRPRASLTSPTRCWVPTWIKRLDRLSRGRAGLRRRHRAGPRPRRRPVPERHGRPVSISRRAQRPRTKQRQAMAMEYINRQIKDDPAVDAAREKLAKQGMVVPAALDLGMVTLQRAQSMKDPAARRAELERAEKTFLAIRGTAGESDQYMLRLGQVYYWLGKQEEGRQEFDKLLAKHQRKAEILFSLAECAPRSGGLGGGPQIDGRGLRENGRRKGSGKASPNSAPSPRPAWTTRSTGWNAATRARTTSRPCSPKPAALRRKPRARTTRRRPSTAKPWRSTSGNRRTRRAQQRCAGLSGRSSRSRGTARPCSAARSGWRRPSASAPWIPWSWRTRRNQISRAAIQDLAGDKLNLRELQMSENIGALYFLVNDQKGLDEIRRRAREHAGLRKGLNYLDRVNVLAPKNVANNSSAMAIYGFPSRPRGAAAPRPPGGCRPAGHGGDQRARAQVLPVQGRGVDRRKMQAADRAGGSLGDAPEWPRQGPRLCRGSRRPGRS